MSGMTAEPRIMTLSHIYKEPGILYIRCDGEVENQTNWAEEDRRKSTRIQ